MASNIPRLEQKVRPQEDQEQPIPPLETIRKCPVQEGGNRRADAEIKPDEMQQQRDHGR